MKREDVTAWLAIGVMICLGMYLYQSIQDRRADRQIDALISVTLARANEARMLDSLGAWPDTMVIDSCIGFEQ